MRAGLVWTADPKRVIAAVKRGKETLESVHRGLREINAVFDVSPMAIHRLNARGGIVNG